MRVRDAADVVRTEGRGDDRFVIEQDARAGFEIGVALRFLQEDRATPAVLRGVDFFVIPVGAFHEADGETRPALPAPIDQVAQVALGVAQISLDDDPGVRPVGELRLGEELLEKLERAVFLRVALHVEIDEGADLLARGAGSGGASARDARSLPPARPDSSANRSAEILTERFTTGNSSVFLPNGSVQPRVSRDKRLEQFHRAGRVFVRFFFAHDRFA